MSEIRREENTVRSTPQATQSEHMEDVTYDPYEARRSALVKVEQVLYLIMVIIEGLIFIRFVLRLLAANPAAGFAQFIYGITAPFVAPFVGLFPNPGAANGSVLELYTLVALIFYPLLFWVLVRILWLALGTTRRGLVSERVDTRRVEPPR